MGVLRLKPCLWRSSVCIKELWAKVNQWEHKKRPHILDDEHSPPAYLWTQILEHNLILSFYAILTEPLLPIPKRHFAPTDSRSVILPLWSPLRESSSYLLLHLVHRASSLRLTQLLAASRYDSNLLARHVVMGAAHCGPGTRLLGHLKRGFRLHKGVQLHGSHHVPLQFDFALHKRHLRIQLSSHEFGKVGVREGNRDIGRPFGFLH